jgi:hypothetical protein
MHESGPWLCRGPHPPHAYRACILLPPFAAAAFWPPPFARVPIVRTLCNIGPVGSISVRGAMSRYSPQKGGLQRLSETVQCRCRHARAVRRGCQTGTF